jgi:TonB family protein
MRTLVASTLLALLTQSGFAQQQQGKTSADRPSPEPTESTRDFSQEALIYKSIHTTMRYEDDGSGVRETRARLQVQTQSGLTHAGQLIFPYNAENETVEFRSVRVVKPDGTVVPTGPENIQDLSSPVAQLAPIYSDARQKHVTVAGLSVGDTVEYDAILTSKPLIHGQFWSSFLFHSQSIVLDEQLELNVPKSRLLKLKGPDGVAPQVREEGDRRIYAWKTSNLTVPKPQELLKSFTIDVRRMLEGSRFGLPKRVSFSTFQTWADLGNWYAALERERRAPTPAIRTQGDEIVRGKVGEEERARALYEWVTRNIRYVSLSFGLGRYQPHAAADVLTNRYGDCKDKTTLLEAFFDAEGIRANAALVNGMFDVDPDVPNLQSFDHVIVVASVAGKEIWLDPTVTVVPYGYLFPQLRLQNALFTSDGPTAGLRKTPAELPISRLYNVDVTGVADEQDNLDAMVNFSLRGDLEVLLRLYNAVLSPAQFNSFVLEAMTKGNRTSYGDSKFTDFRLDNPSDISEPLKGQFHFLGKLSYIDLKGTSPERLVEGVYSALSAKSSQIRWVSEESAGPAQYLLSVAVTVPKAKLTGDEKPIAKRVSGEFGDYEYRSKWDRQTWRADWRLSLSGKALSSRQNDYSKFQDTVLATLNAGPPKTEPSPSVPERVVVTKAEPATQPSPPSSSKAESSDQSQSPAHALYLAARRAGNERQYANAAQLLEEAVAKDPNYKPAWNFLGWIYNNLRKYDKAEVALRKAIALDPSDSAAYNNLGQALAGQKKYEEAVPQYQKQIALNPRDQWAHENLGHIYVLLQQYEKAIPELETAASIKPDNPYIPYNLGLAYAKTGEPEKAAKSFKRSVDLEPVPSRWNSVAYQMALNNIDLDQAQKYSELAIASAAHQMSATSLDHLTNDDIRLTSALAAYWDTFGWIQFQKGNLPEALKYIRSAWELHSTGEVSDHLAQIYEKQGHKEDAIRFYSFALTGSQPFSESRARLAGLLGADPSIDSIIEKAKLQLKEARTVAVKNSRQAEGIAEFWILLSPGPTVREVKFISGDEDLNQLRDDIQHTSFPDCFAEATDLRLVRRARLSCLSTSPSCSLFLNSAETVQPPDSSDVPVPSAPPTRVQVDGTVLAGKIKSKVNPSYPDLARQAGIDGLVKLHAIIGKDGTIQQLSLISGHPLLAQAALDAVRQWRYEPTLVNGQAVEVDTTIEVFFQLQKK